MSENQLNQTYDDRIMKSAEAELVEAFSSNRERLWQTVHIRLDPRLCGRIDPDDVLQEAYMDAVSRLKQFVSQRDSWSLFVWIRVILGQTIINVHRRHFSAKKRDASREVASSPRGHKMSATTASLVEHFVGNLTSPSQAAIRRESVAELEAALNQMKSLDREILTLRHFEDMSNKEAAELLGIDPKAASIRYIRAIERLKKFADATSGISE